MPKIDLAGHPMHPQMIVAPAGLIPASLVFDIMYATTKNEAYAKAAYYSLMGGVMGGVVAGVAGAGDLLTTKPGSTARKVGLLHGGLNLTLLSMSTVNLLMRRGKVAPSGPVPMTMNAVGNLAMVFSAWLGGELVYRYGMRVAGQSPVADAPTLDLPGGKAMGSAFRSMEQKAVDRGI